MDRDQRHQPLNWLFWITAVSLLLLLTACGSNATSTAPAAKEIAVATAVPTATPTAIPTDTPVPTCDPFTSPASAPPASVPTYGYRVIHTYPHDPDAFTQGLLFADGVLYESTGIKRTPSSLREVDLNIGEVTQFLDVGSDYFAEGLVLWQDRLIQLTWQSQVAFVYDRESFELLDTWEYDTEGWGITHDGRCLIMSDGTSTLTFRDPETFAEVGHITVQDQNGPVAWLNELEFIEGEVWANVWQTNRIVRIDPATGQVVGSIDLTGLLDPAALTQPVDVLNGIAYDGANGRIFVTGKLWPTLFEIELVPEGNN
ncbi:MAG: glutaminyl-peptide cyclotransferase [Anaerolineaceae bacterium]|nr:glutaminyl-peptide cyclotransferase [Anaerolineaceae bacterium]